MRIPTLITFLALFLISACSPNLYYLGDTYPSNTNAVIDVYYTKDDIMRDYRVIGQLSADNEGNSFLDLDDIKKAMIDEAKQRGADGILFLYNESLNNKHFIASELIKYR